MAKRKFGGRYISSSKRRRITGGLNRWRRRKGLLGSVPRSMMRVHHFKRTYQGSDITASSSGNALGALSFRLTSIPESTEFTYLFDVYRINLIVWKLVPSFTSFDANPVSTNVLCPNVHTVIDHDDDTDPSNLNAMLQYSTYRMSRGNRTIKRVFRPSILQETVKELSGNTIVSTSKTQRYKQWIDCEDAATEHYGVKYFIDALNASAVNPTTFAYKQYVTLYFSCKGVR